MNEEFLPELRDEILDARRRLVARRTRRTRRFRVIAAAAAVSLAVAAVGVVATADDVAAGVDITRDGSDLVVRLTDLETDPAEVEEAAAAAGLNVTVDTVPVGPSMIGRFVSAEGDALPPEVRTVDTAGSSGFDGFRVDAEFDGAITLTMGRPARPGEKWAVTSDATNVGEPLECVDLAASSLSEIVEQVEEAGATTTRVFVIDGGGEVPAGDLGAAGDATVLRVTRTGVDDYLIDAVLDADSTPTPPLPRDPNC